MVGIFSRFSVGRNVHRRTQSALQGDGEAIPPNSENTSDAAVTCASSAATHGIDVAIDFKPLEHPPEPLDNDQPIQCPLPEPSILNDGRIWKERASAGSIQRRAEMPVVQEGPRGETGPVGTKPPRLPTKRTILPSISAPEHSLHKLLEECNESVI